MVNEDDPKDKELISSEEVDAATLKKLEEGFKKLKDSKSKSLLNKHLSKEIFEDIKKRKTRKGASLFDCIQSGIANLDSGCGIYAADADSYRVFKKIFNPVIEDYHVGFKPTDKHPDLTWGNTSSWPDLDPNGDFINSTRIRCARSVEGYSLNPCMKEEDYLNLQKQVTSSFKGLTGELKGTYYPLEGMSKEVQQKLIDDHFLFKEGDRFLQAANSNHFWPKGRGIYHNDTKTFLVWVNEEDHLRIISMQKGGNIKEVYERLVNAATEMSKIVKFSRDPRFGYLTFCPTNLGTTIRASVHIKVPKLAKNYQKLEEIAAKFNLQVRGTRGEHSESEGGVYDISNKRRLGLTEFQAVDEMYKGIKEIIALEKAAK